jgi:hypothetical protein
VTTACGDGPQAEEQVMTVVRRAAVVLLVVAIVAGCRGGTQAPPDEVVGLPLVAYQDDRIGFVHPEGWRVQTDDGDEQRVRVELLDGDQPIAAILVTWPVIHAHSDLDQFVTFFGVDRFDEGVEDLDQAGVDVPGAVGAELQTYAVSGRDETGALLTGRAWTLLAAAEVGRNVAVTVTIEDDAVPDPVAVGDTVIASIVLTDDWAR